MQKTNNLNIKDAVMKRIESGEIRVRPKMYFIVGGIFSLVGTVGSIVSTIYLMALGKFLLKSHGPMGVYRWNELVQALPFWFVPLTITSVIVGFVLLKRYDFSYRKSPLFLALGLAAAIWIATYLVGVTGLDEVIFRQRGPRYRNGFGSQKMVRQMSTVIFETSPEVETGK